MGVRSPRLHYRPDVDGLRAVAVIPVVLYHAGFAPFSGGYVGVDVFFVISGFLIAGIISREISQGRFSILNFYERRARRILPALFAVIATVLGLGWLISWPQDFSEISESVLATVFFGSNMYFWQTSDYFATATEFRPLLHTWSLAIEEQFYVFFPIFLILAARRPRANLVFWVMFLLVASFVLNVGLTVSRPMSAFYLAPTRAWELLIGATLALNILPSWSGRRVREVASIAGIALILGAVFAFDADTAFPGIAALAPCIGAALVIQAGRGDTALTSVSQVLSRRPFVFVGLVSYSLYLWHWPILAFSRSWMGTTHLSIEWALTCILVSFVLAIISWHIIERPFRAKGTFSRVGIVRFSAGGAAMLVCLASLVLVLNGSPGRFSPSVLDALAGARDIEENRLDCMGHKRNNEYCVIGYEGAAPSAILIGDSHAAALMSAVGHVFEVNEMSGYIAAHRACPPLLGVRRVGSSSSASCTVFLDSIIEFIDTRKGSLKVAVLAARWPLNVAGNRPSGEPGSTVALSSTIGEKQSTNGEFVQSGLEEMVSRLSGMGLKVIILGGVPEIGWDVPKATAAALVRGDVPPTPPSMDTLYGRHFETDRILSDVSSRYTDTVFVPLHHLLCTPGCEVLDGTTPVYIDDDHLSKHGSKDVLGPRLAAEFANILGPRFLSSLGERRAEFR